METHAQPVEDVGFCDMTPNRRRIVLSAIGGYFIDGYDLLILAGALLAIVPELGLSPGSVGLLTASAFIGMAVGSPIAGPLTDRFGRRIVFMVAMVIFLISSIAFLFAETTWQLIAIRFAIGVAIGADMPCIAALITEFVPGKKRGTFLALGGVAWMIGSLVAILVTLGIFTILGEEAWRWVMATGAVPAVILLVMRYNAPESPYWLYSRGRKREAIEAWKKATGEDAEAETFDDSNDQESENPNASTKGSSLRKIGLLAGLKEKPLLMMLICMCVYWGCNNLYGSAVLLYQPTLIQRITEPSGYTSLLFSAGTILFSVLLGSFVALWLMDRVGRRLIAIGGTLLMSAASVALWLQIDSVVVVFIAFAIIIGVINGGTSLAFYSWAPELFPTHVRGRAVGIVNMVGKGGSVVGTLLLPTVLDSIGSSSFLLIALVGVLNVCVVYWLAPETRGKSLKQIQQEIGARFGSKARDD
ncbi:sugar porter family MFS transporter [Salinicola corii]|uniref:Sugar porter family MFS transporter n=1 Tax=Salinicola corii TaxID=2606937 RepID=A0A640W8C6_9GAMM|nr:MFS transporter [Salinicola corii]KAA0016032.1 sugar porter family MFS transporter [Salinicola corii]